MKNKLRIYINRKFFIYPKTTGIMELREELFSMMCDKYDDCLKSGMPKTASYKQALTVMEDYKMAVREVERGSSLEALRKKTVSFLAFSAFYYMILTAVYLYISMVTVHSFERTWLIIVAGTFLYLIYFSINMFDYTEMFDMRSLSRIFLGCLFASLIPSLYVLPSLYFSVVLGRSIWGLSWLVIPVIGFIYIIADLTVFGKKGNRLAFWWELASAGFLLTSCIYLAISFFYHLWSVAWIVFVVYLAIVALTVFINEKFYKR